MSGFTTYTWIHTILSLIELVAGFVVVIELIGSRMSSFWTGTFLISAIATSTTGFGFNSPFQASHVFGIISLVVLGAAIIGLYLYHLAGAWRWIYAIGIVIALYLDTFVAIVQAFRKIPLIAALAPTQTEPPFAIAQLVTLVVFAWLGYAAAKRFHPAAAVPAH